MKKILFVSLVLLGLSSHAAEGGSEGGGGGDAYVADFVAVSEAMIQWMFKHENSLGGAVTAAKFKVALDPKRVVSTFKPLNHRGQEVDLYYDASTDYIQINRQRWSSIKRTSEKMRLAAHEIFRRMRDPNVNDDEYQISRLINFDRVGKTCTNCTFNDPLVTWRALFAKALPIDFQKFQGKDAIFADQVDPTSEASGRARTVLYIDHRGLFPRIFAASLLNTSFTQGQQGQIICKDLYPIDMGRKTGYRNVCDYSVVRNLYMTLEVQPESIPGTNSEEQVVYSGKENSKEFRKISIRETNGRILLRWEIYNELGEWLDVGYMTVLANRDLITP